MIFCCTKLVVAILVEESVRSLVGAVAVPRVVVPWIVTSPVNVSPAIFALPASRVARSLSFETTAASRVVILVSAVVIRVSSALICAWVSVTAPVILGNVLLIVLLIRRRCVVTLVDLVCDRWIVCVQRINKCS